MPAVEVTSLTVRYGAAGTPPAVDGIAEAGEVLVVLGPNGAGKTSTMETLEGYRRPVAGRVRVLGLDPQADHAALTGRVGIMLQRGGIYPMLGPRRVLDLFAGYYPDPVPTDELLALAGLRAVTTTPWRHLSGGEQQRLSLALALIGRPRVAFLDEPTAGVDPEGRLAIRAVVTDRIVIVSSGRVVLAGTPTELSGGAGSNRVSFGAPPGLDTGALALQLGQGVSVQETAPGRYRIEGASGPAATATLATWLAARDATLSDLVTGRTLEDVYFDAV